MQEREGDLVIPDLAITLVEELSVQASVTTRQHGTLVLGFRSAEGAKAMVDITLGKVQLDESDIFSTSSWTL